MAKEILKNSKIIEKNNYKKCQSKKKSGKTSNGETGFNKFVFTS